MLIGNPYDSFPNGSAMRDSTAVPPDFKQSMSFKIHPLAPVVSDEVWRERVKMAGIIGFLKGCLEGLKLDSSDDICAKIDAALKHAEEMQLRP